MTSEEHWRVETNPIDENTVEYRLVYRDRVHKAVRDGLENFSAKRTLEAEANSYNEQGWVPSFKTYIMSGVRILNDSLHERNGRVVDYVYQRSQNGNFSVCCTGAAQFWFDSSLVCTRFAAPEGKMDDLNEEEQADFNSLVDLEKLALALRKAKPFNQEDYSAARRNAKRRTTKREERREAELEKLNKWKEGR